MSASVDIDEVRDIGESAYIFLYPLVMMDLTRREMRGSQPTAGSGAVPMNRFVHLREFPAADFRTVVRPNFDTLYSTAWLDLMSGPVVVSAGAVPDGRFYQLPMYDMWTDAFASPGQRTTGTEPGSWAVVPPGWSGVVPDSVDRIDAPTACVWIIGRTQTNGPSDYATVHRFQDELEVTPLAYWQVHGRANGAGRTRSDLAPRPAADGIARPGIQSTDEPTDDASDRPTDPRGGEGGGEGSPLARVNRMSAEEFFDYGLGLLATHPPHLTDWSLIARMSRIGLVAGSRLRDLDAGIQDAMPGAPAQARAALSRALPRLANVVNGWQMNLDAMGVYGNFYVKRAIVAMVGLGANAAEDAVYPVLVTDSDGNRVTGDSDYVLHFNEGELPPVHAFWSATIYDEQGFQAANPLNRFAIGDRDELRYNRNGSLDVYIQHERPSAEKESNWLPTPRGPIGVTMRLYAPKSNVLAGTWAPPAVRRQS